jgi:hypothetical protein
MNSARSLAAFRQARPEIADLLRTSHSKSDVVPPDRRMSAQEAHLRHVVVALIGLLQACLSELLEEHADELCDSWDELLDVQKRYVSVQTVRRLSKLIESLPESELAESKKVEQLRVGVQECAEWHRQPALLARSAYRQRLDGFFADNGTKAIDRAISQFGNCELSFFNWLSKYCPRYRGMSDLLDSIIALRNDVAHGSFNRRTTLREVRLYRIAIYRLISKFGEYQNAVAVLDHRE